MCLRLPETLRAPIAHPMPLIAQDVFGLVLIKPEHTL